MHAGDPIGDEIASVPDHEASTRSCISMAGDNELQPLRVVVIQAEDATAMVKNSSSETDARSKIQFLDGIRGTAVIFVVCQHVEYFRGMDIGAFGVDMFFVLSAFLLTMILDEKFQVLRAERAPPRRWCYALIDYGARRILRVYPLFALVAILVSLSSDEHKAQWYHVRQYMLGGNWSLLKVLIFDSNLRFFVMWTLPLELTYYLIIPVFVAVMTILKRWWWLPSLPLLGWIVYTGLYQVRHSYMGLAPHLPTFVCGSLAAIMYNRLADYIHNTNFKFKKWHRIGLLSLEALVLFLLVSEGFEALVFDWFGPSPFLLPNGDHFVCLHLSIIIVCEMLQPSVISMTLEWCVLRYAGKISFSVYLLHPRILFSDFILAQDNYYTHFFSLWALVFFWGTVSYYVVERPCQLLAAWIGKKIKTMDAEASANQPRKPCI